MAAPTAHPSPLRYVACISYPRSGHHLTVRVLQQYFKHDFKYCQFYNNQEGNCCQSFPCTDESVRMTKNHDMELNRPNAVGLQKQPEVPYLVLIRNFLEAVVSDYNLFLRRNEDTYDAWVGFSERKIQYYKKFMQKWVLEDDGMEKQIIRYEKLTAEPVEQFTRMIEFFHPPTPVDQSRLESIINQAVLEDVKPTGIDVIRNFGVKNRRKLQDFKHFDENHFTHLECELDKEFEGIGYTRRFAA